MSIDSEYCFVCGCRLATSPFVSIMFDGKALFFCGDDCHEQWNDADCKTCLDQGEISGGYQSGPASAGDDGMQPCPDCCGDSEPDWGDAYWGDA